MRKAGLANCQCDRDMKQQAHPNLSDEINRNIAQSAQDGGVYLNQLGEGDYVLFMTQNRMYRVVRKGNDYWIDGHPEFCHMPTLAKIHGSTWGGSMLKIGWIGKGMYLEFSTKAHRRVTTSRIESVTLYRNGERQ